jgi:hypothetical protein
MRRSRLATALLVVYTLINVGGAIYAAAMGEMGHMALHVALLLPVGFIVARRMSRSAGRLGSTAEVAALDAAFPSRLTNLERSIDAVAIEVERISEGQRNLTNILVDQDPERVREEQG